MWMSPKSHTGSYGIVINHSKSSKPHTFGIIIICETEAMIALKPTMIDITTSICLMKNYLSHRNNRNIILCGYNTDKAYFYKIENKSFIILLIVKINKPENW